MSGPLKGLKVIEMEGLGPCPLAGQLMADLGADVIVIHKKSGKTDPSDINNRSKRSIAINLKTQAGLTAALRLMRTADILIEGMRPGVMEKLGLGPAACQSENPQLIYGRMTGWGQTGPLAQTAGHDLNYLSLTGALSMMGRAGEPPMPPLNLAADYGGGAMFLLFGILSALYHRQTSGKGQIIDVSMVEGVSAMMGLFHQWQSKGMWAPERESNLLDGGAPFYRCYETADGKHVSLAALEPQFFEQFLRLAGLDANQALDQYDKTNWPQRRAEYETMFRQRTRDEWEALFNGSDACVTPVLTMEEAAQHPHNTARRTLVEASGITQAAPVPRFSGTPSNNAGKPARPGGNTFEILAALGFGEEEISRMKKDGTIA